MFCNNQYGFHKGHSTSLALIDLFDNISSAIDRKEHSVGIFLDLSKAFDTVDHNILLDKLNYYGIRGLALDLIKSYLSDRMQYVQYNQTNSIRQNISCGVPQGSILGPLLFLL
jgi:retron-type reverse transcriptase